MGCSFLMRCGFHPPGLSYFSSRLGLPSTRIAGLAILCNLRYGSYQVLSDAICLRYGSYQPCFRPARSTIWVILTISCHRFAFDGSPSSYFPTQLANFGGQKCLFLLGPMSRIRNSSQSITFYVLFTVKHTEIEDNDVILQHTFTF